MYSESMNTKTLVQRLVLSGWSFWQENGRLKYRAPKGEATSSRLQALKAGKEDIVSLLRTEPQALDICPLSYGQRALWFLWKLSPQSTAYNQSLPLHINCRTEADAWHQACALLVAKHPMLRTIFPVLDGEPIQQVQACDPEDPSFPGQGLAIDWVQTDARTWSRVQVQAGMEAAHQEVFDLEHGPLIRFRWYTQAQDSHFLLLTMHHIVCDGWSLEIIYHDLSTLHQQIREQAPLEIPAQEHTYQDFVRWQKKLLHGPEGEGLWAFWRSQLAGPLPVLNLPLDYPRPVQPSYEGSAHHFSLDSQVSQALRDLAAREEITLYALWVTIFMLFLHRLTGQEEVIIGSPTSGRSRPEFSYIVGYFVDPVVLRAHIGQEQTFGQLLRSLRQVVRQALEHSDYPFALLVEKLHVEREPNRSPLFDVSMNYVSFSQSNQAQSRIEVVDISQADGKFDLTLNVFEGHSRMQASLGYNTNLFSKQSIAAFARSLHALVEQIVHHPDQNVQTLPLCPFSGPLPPPAMQGRTLEVGSAHLVPRLFEQQVERTGQEIAVQAQGEDLSYAQLNARANTIARALQEQGVGPGSLVALGLGRTVDFISGLLGVLKAGAAYLPLEADAPLEMLAFMLDKAQTSVLIVPSATQELAREIQARTGVDLLGLDSLPQPDPGQHNPRPEVDLDHPAYVMFTSGSTGRPKGVEITHRNLSNYLLSILSDLDILPGRNFALISALNADLGNTAIFPCLCTGGCLHIFSDQERLESMAFAQAMQTHGIDYLKIVPSHLAALMDSSAGSLCLPARAVILGGESCPWDLAREIIARDSDCAVFNHYGPTETTIGVLTARIMEEDFVLPSSSLPLSRAVANTAVYLLDEHMNPVPRGVPGEMYIAGPCLARGYIHDPELTAGSFVPYPDAPAQNQNSRCRGEKTEDGGQRTEGDALQGQVLYKTGDMARILADGSLSILGRKDRQVNIRGIRIELAHIESCLREHPAVSMCAVVPDQPGDKAEHLLAYVLPADDFEGREQADHTAFEAQLMSFLHTKLSRLMLPARIIPVPELPLTRAGKIDTRALQSSGPDLGQPRPDRMAPRDMIELKLHRIWSEVLGLKEIGVEDSFFQLGGHSLLALRLAGHIFDAFGRRISLAVFFRNPTISRIAELLRQDPSPEDNPILVQLHPGEAAPNIFLLPGAGGNVLYFTGLARHLGSSFPVWALQGLGLDESHPIPASIEETAGAYIHLIRTQVQAQGPYALIGHSFGALTAFEMARQLSQQGQETTFLGIIDNPAPGRTRAGEYQDWSHRQWLQHIGLRIEKLYHTDLNMDQLDLNHLDLEEQTRKFITRLTAAGVLPPDVNQVHFKRFIQVYKANARAAAIYQPPVLAAPTPVTLFQADEHDPELDLAEPDSSAGRESPGSDPDPSLGWQELFSRPVEVVSVPGTHLSMLAEPNVYSLAAEIGQRLGGWGSS